MPLIATRGAASAQGFGEFAKSGPVNYIEDVFSTYLYTGNGTTQTITNGIDLSTKGGMVWIKQRNQATSHRLFDTNRGIGNSLVSNSTAANAYFAGYLNAFNVDGFGVGTANDVNESGFPLVSWTFRKQAKFFDVVTYTGNGTSGRTIAHSLGSVPGCIIVKVTSTTESWVVYHQSLGATKGLILSGTNAAVTDSSWWNDTAPTSTAFTVGNSIVTNVNNETYVAYLFAHNAGGFGASGSDNVISCGSFTTDASGNATVNLGYEPQWVMFKSSSVATSWRIFDNMRGLVVGTGDRALYANNTVAETQDNTINPTSTGFDIISASTSANFVYIAIRRGPMKTPTSGTSVFQPVARAGTGGSYNISLNFSPDHEITKARNTIDYNLWNTRLTANQTLISDTTNAATDFGWWTVPKPWDVQNGFNMNSFANMNSSSYNYIDYYFRRAPSFFDVVCYTGDGAAYQNITHNLGVTPGWVICKNRSLGSTNWPVAWDTLGNYLYLNSDTATAANTGYAQPVNSTTIRAYKGTGDNGNTSGSNYVAYLFASCPGVSKVGSYSGTGATQTISCGFAARFVMIKRTDLTGSWWVWDTARGMVAGTDPRLALNSTAAETNANWVYTDASGFQIVTTDATVNASGGSYIFLAIA